MLKVCTSCQKSKKLDQFGKHSKSKDSLRSVCKECRKIEAHARYAAMDKQQHILNTIRGRAKKQNIPFDLEYDDLTPPKVCPVFGVEMTRIEPHSNSSKRFSISIDRIIPEKGYTKGNIQIISQLANVMKHDASIEELKTFARWILKTYEDKK